MKYADVPAKPSNINHKNKDIPFLYIYITSCSNITRVHYLQKLLRNDFIGWGVAVVQVIGPYTFVIFNQKASD